MVFRREPDDTARRRMTAIDLAAETAFDLGPLNVAPASLALTISGDTANVEPRIMQVLVMLARRPGEVISRAMFAEACWGGLHVSEDAIHRAIGRVRKLGAWSGAFAVETVPRVGYRLRLSEKAAASAETIFPLLAVLPFDALSSDPELEFFARGLADEILHMLARATRIRVIGRGSSFQLSGDAKSATKVKALLGASHLLDGSVQKAGTRLHIVLTLVETASDTVLWSQSYDRSVEDMLGLQTRMAAAVAKVLHHKFGPEDRGLVDPALHEQMVQAFRRALDGPITSADVKAIDALVEQAPDYALGWAYASEARNYLRMRPEVGEATSKALYVEQREHAERALALDPKLAPALLALGNLQPPCGAFTERERIFRAADGYGWPMPPLTYLLLQVGRSSEALAIAEIGREREPLVGPVRMAHQLALAQLGRIDEWEEMVESDRRSHPLAPHEWATVTQLAALLGRDRMVEDLISGVSPTARANFLVQDAIETCVAIRDPSPRRRDRLLLQLSQKIEQDGFVPFFPMTVAAVVADIESVWAFIARSDFSPLLEPGARLGGAPHNTTALFLPHAAALRRDTRFTVLCDRIGLTRHWNETQCWPDCANELV